MKLATAEYKLIGARSLISKKTGRMCLGDTVHLPYLMRNSFKDVDKLFKITIDGEGNWPVKVSGGLGDKIYSLPVFYVLDSRIGIEQRDKPIFRLVKDKIKLCNENQVSIMGNLEVDGPEIADQIAANLGVDLKMKMPVLQTTVKEKKTPSNLFSRVSDYVVVCEHASGKERSWKGCVEFVKVLREMGVTVYVVWKKDCDLFPIIERASCVISTNTSVIPMAGGFQVPVIAVGQNTGRRIKYFLDADWCDTNDSKVIVEVFEKMMSRSRVKCWCGDTAGNYLVVNNMWVVDCSNCGTRRQDIKATKQGIERFYKDVYHCGWRELVEGESPYFDRWEEDVKLSSIRYVSQWKSIVENRRNDNSKWLDVGCGNGGLIHVLKENGWQAEGIEPDLSLVNSAYTKTGCRTFTKWNLASSYDVISYIDVLEHGFVKEELLNSIEHLNPNGCIICELPIAQEEPKHYRRFQHIFYFTDKTFSKLVDHVGLEIEIQLKPIKGKMTFILKRRGERNA